jgi:hypothetical protein
MSLAGAQRIAWSWDAAQHPSRAQCEVRGAKSLRVWPASSGTLPGLLTPPPPPRAAVSLLGPGCLKAASTEIHKLGGSKALIVTDKFLAKALGPVIAMLSADGLAHAIYDGVTPNPTDVEV